MQNQNIFKFKSWKCFFENVCSPGEAKCRSVLAGRSEMSFCVCRIKSFVEAREVNESLKSLQSYIKSVENHLNNKT